MKPNALCLPICATVNGRFSQSPTQNILKREPRAASRLYYRFHFCDSYHVIRRLKFWGALAALGLFGFHLHAGGSGLNVAIIVNQDSTNSIQLGNYYREKRNIPPQNVFRIYWPGTNTEWSLSDYNTNLLNPFVSALASRGLTNQIDYVVLSMDIPYRVDNTGNGDTNKNSSTSALFYGYVNDPHNPNVCEIAAGSTNLYANSEGIFRQTPPISANSNSWLVTMITQSNLAMAEQIINQGILGDSTFPTNTVWLDKSDDFARNVRFTAFDNAIFNTRIKGNYSMMRTNSVVDVTNFFTLVIDVPGPTLGYQNGAYNYAIATSPFIVPGGFVDNLDSFGGQIFENSGETSILPFLAAGASGSYGTVIEPCAYLEKFPDPQDYFFQSRGFSLAECYYMSLITPYEGLIVGEPLSAPFAKPAAGSWVGLASNTVLSATTNLSVQFNASDAQHPVQQFDVFVDGAFFKTVTNIAPGQGNVLSVTINGHNTTSTVSAGATILSATSNLVTALNVSSYTNLTKVRAFLHGDRIELQSGAPYTTNGSNITFTASSTNSSGPLTTFIRTAGSGSNFVDSIAWGYNTYIISGTVNSNSTLQVIVTKTNGTMITVIATNSPGNTDLPTFVQQFANLVNTAPALTNNDGLAVEDILSGGSTLAEFNIRALGQGFAAAQIKAVPSGPGMLISHPSGNTALVDNIDDLRPRAHLYITAGTSNLSLTFPFVSTNLPDGYHELEAVAYEGSHVHTQARTTQNVIIQNTPLSATLNTLVGGSNSALEATLQFSVTPNTNTISKIELFSTGGSLGAVTNQPTANFSVIATNLGLGLHPFYAVVTDNAGHQYRTAATNIRLVGPDSPFPLQLGAPPPILAWPATAGRSYDILTYTNISGTFQLLTNVVASNNLAQWLDTNSPSPQLFYRVRVSP